jgi:beta-mannosidase
MPGSIADWKRYWTADDSTLRSEVGMPGASSTSLINKYAGNQKTWPANRSNPLWVHGGDWWIQWDRFKDQIGDLEPAAALEKYCGLSRELQASALGFAAASAKAHFPHCGGFFVWMGHDCFPCTANTSIIDIDGNPKPAYWALKEVFRN